MGRMYRTNKHKIHKHFLKFSTTEEALQNRPEEVEEEHWPILCAQFSSPAYIKRCAINKRNRAARQTHHCCGTKSFARVSTELVHNSMAEGVEVDRIQIWFETHFNKKTQKWCDAKSKDIYDQLCAMKEKAETEGPPMTVEEIFDTVLPPRSGYACGLGPGPKPPSKTERAAAERAKAAEESLKKAEQMNADLRAEMAAMKARQDGMEASLYERLQADIRQHYDEQGWSINNNSLPSFMQGD